MFYIKNAKINAPFLQAKIPLCASFEDEAVLLTASEGTAAFSLFEGERSVRVRCAAGRCKAGGGCLIAETEVFYTYSCADNSIVLCDNDYTYDGPGEAPLSAQVPALRVFAQREDAEPARSASTLLRVSAREGERVRQNESARLLLGEGSDKIEAALRASLRGVAAAVEQAALEAGIAVTMRINAPEEYKDALLVLENGILQYIYDPEIDGPLEGLETTPLVGGWATSYTTKIRGAVFYNIIGSSNDPRPSGNSWLAYYAASVGGDEDNYKYCASQNEGLTAQCARNKPKPGYFVGGHIHKTLTGAGKIGVLGKNYYVTGLSEKAHELAANSEYRMLPICKWHNNHDYVCMQTHQAERFLNLTGFMK